MNIGDKVRVTKHNTVFKQYGVCEIRNRIEIGKLYFVCNDLECAWFSEDELESVRV